MIVLLTVVAGGLGASSRFVLDGAIRSRLGDRFPWATLIINVTGSLLLGVLAGLVLHQGTSGDVRTVLGTGFCGGYTTFSSASLETVRLTQRGARAAAVRYCAGTAALTALAAGIGLLITR